MVSDSHLGLCQVQLQVKKSWLQAGSSLIFQTSDVSGSLEKEKPRKQYRAHVISYYLVLIIWADFFFFNPHARILFY